MRALVTGSSGFVGRHFAHALEQRGYEVTRCDPKQPGVGGDCMSAFVSYWADFMPDAAKPVTWDLIVHCAALVEGRETIDGNPAMIAAYNLMLDAALFEHALRAGPGRVIYFSSSAAYPVALQTTVEARTLVESDAGGEPDQTYGFVKLTGERLAVEVRKAGVPVTVVRPFSGYGEDQDDCYPFPAMIARAAGLESPFVVWGDGRQVRDFIHVDDIVAAVLTLVDQNVDGPINLGTGIPTSMDDLARLVQQAVGYTAPIKHLSDKPSGVQHRVADITLLLEHYTPTISLEQGIDRALTAALTGARAA